MTIEQVQDILVAVAPIVGTARTASAAAKITEAVGITVIALEAELEAEDDASPESARTGSVRLRPAVFAVATDTVEDTSCCDV